MMQPIFKKIILICLVSITYVKVYAQNTFDALFTGAMLRINYTESGDAQQSDVFLTSLRHDPQWGGSHTYLIDTLNYGENRLIMSDSVSGKVIYTTGFSTLFSEWRTTADARSTKRSMEQCVVMPFPRKTVQVEILERLPNQTFISKVKWYINPSNYFINREPLTPYPVNKIKVAAPSDKALDIVIIAEGYTQAQMKQFRSDAQRFAGYLTSWKPFKQYADYINVWAVEAPSVNEGPDIPGEGVWRNTVLGSTFYTFGTDRYLSVGNITTMRDIAALTPYDQIFVLVNSSKYGGGGIYNFYNVCTANDSWAEFVAVHEFGHGFGGLADEYYTSDVAYDNYYDLTAEPAQPNITTLVHFDKKWKNMVSADTPIPTPAKSSYKNNIGAFEGGGYLEKGIYRPALDCSMKSLLNDAFCPVCVKAIETVLKTHIK